MHTTCSPIHWAMFVSLSPQCDSSNLSGPGRRRIGINRSIFLQLHLLKFDVALTLLRCPAVCAKSKMRFWGLLNWWQDWSHLVGFLDLFFDFSMAEIYKSCWMWISCLGHINRENVFDAHFIHQDIAYICIHHWALSIRILLCNRLRVSDLFQGANSVSALS